MLQLLQIILIVLLLILMLLAALVANFAFKPERRTPAEWVEDRKIQKEQRAEKRAEDREDLKKKELMRKVEEYDGTVR